MINLDANGTASGSESSGDERCGDAVERGNSAVRVRIAAVYCSNSGTRLIGLLRGASATSPQISHAR
ncbi:hypothetical protein ACIBG0_20950 [Nocardia sp. NPDC050630]|uniref:hypothetical protein n=1 Tax=Nocardia sp. NPDC050630 TaxID=3364321 RepID=UPI003799068F